MNGASQQSIGPGDIVTVELIDGNRGNHRIVGDITKRDYGHRAHGQQFKMLVVDATIAPRKVRIVEDKQPAAIRHAQPAPLPPVPTAITESVEIVAPVAIMEEEPDPEPFAVWEPEVFDFTTIWGINDERAQVLIEMGIRSITGLLTLSESKLETVLEVNTTTAKRILSNANEKK